MDDAIGIGLSANQIKAASGVFMHKDGSMTFDDEASAKNMNYIPELEVTNLNQNHRGSIYYIAGEITNTSDTTIDELVKMVIFDKEGLVLKIQNVSITLQPGETTNFEEIVGEEEPGVEVLLQEF